MYIGKERDIAGVCVSGGKISIHKTTVFSTVKFVFFFFADVVNRKSSRMHNSIKLSSHHVEQVSWKSPVVLVLK